MLNSISSWLNFIKSEAFTAGERFHSSSSCKWLFIEKAEQWRDIPLEAPWWSPDLVSLGGLQNIGQFHQLVGWTGLIFKQTLTGSVPKWMTRNRYPVDTCTPQLASRVICIYVFAPCVRFYSRDFRRELARSPGIFPSCFLLELLHVRAKLTKTLIMYSTCCGSVQIRL